MSLPEWHRITLRHEIESLQRSISDHPDERWPSGDLDNICEYLTMALDLLDRWEPIITAVLAWVQSTDRAAAAATLETALRAEEAAAYADGEG